MPATNKVLMGLFFEVEPHLGHSEHYFSYVEKLKPELVKYSGLIWLNRYQALSNDFSLLSYQLWDSEKSIENWRNNKAHRSAQEAGIKTHFKDYRIRVGERVACWPVNATIKLKTVSPSRPGSLLLSIQSDSAIPSSAFAKYGSFERVYCELSASSQFVTLVRPNNLLCAKKLSLSIMPDLAFKTDLFLISRDYSMARCDQASSDSEMN